MKKQGKLLKKPVKPPIDMKLSLYKKKGGNYSSEQFPPFVNLLPGNVLLSHKVSFAVPSALESLTTVFGMVTGVSSPLRSPEKTKN